LVATQSIRRTLITRHRRSVVPAASGSVESLVSVKGGKTTSLRKMFFKLLGNNSVQACTFFRLPPGRVIELGIQIEM